jgi:hypothetical protein
MAKQKAQHVIPNCYLKDWCDPKTPPGHTPYIWRVSKDGTSRKKRSPEKSFTSTDRYTITMPDGTRDLTVENTLAGLEDRFARLRPRIRREEKLAQRDRLDLCLFTAAMQGRTIRAGDHLRSNQQKLYDQVSSMERQYNIEPDKSRQLAEMMDRAPQDNVMLSLDNQAPLYFAMEMTILITDDPVGFITSDTPCVWRNPQAHTMPPFYRSPGLAQKDIEVSLPLTPQHMLLISHVRYPFYSRVGTDTVLEANRLARHYCTEEFVSWKGETDPRWFEKGEMPADAWENTEEGKEAMRHQMEWDEMRKSMPAPRRPARTDA